MQPEPSQRKRQGNKDHCTKGNSAKRRNNVIKVLLAAEIRDMALQEVTLTQKWESCICLPSFIGFLNQAQSMRSTKITTAHINSQ